MPFSKTAVLSRVLGCGWKTAKEILEGTRTMNLDQKVRLEKYNKEASEEYKIKIL